MTMKDLYFKLADMGYDAELIGKYLNIPVSRVKMWLRNDYAIPDYLRSDLMRLSGCDGLAEDQYFTDEGIAMQVIDRTREVLTNLDYDLTKYTYLEPSAGNGSFFKQLPDPKIGFDVEPLCENVIQQDFLRWEPDIGNCIAIGNPPFGYKGHLALQFVNHCSTFADAVSFILPQSFESDGKGMPSKRISKMYRLALSEKLESNAFYAPDGRLRPVICIHQIYVKLNHHLLPEETPRPSCKSIVKIMMLSNTNARMGKRNVDMIGKCDLYIPSTCFRGMQCYKSFEDLPNKRGFGIVILKHHEKVRQLLVDHDWEKSSYRSTNNAMNLRTSVIEDVLIAAGIHD